MLTRAQFLIAVAAGIGGIAPNLVNLAQGFTGIAPTVPGGLYWIGVAIFFVLGAAVALIFSETLHSKAFFLGVSVPALIAAAQTQHALNVPVATPPKANAMLEWFVGDAHAQTQTPLPVDNGPPAATEPPRKITLRSMKPCKDCELWFYNAQGDPIERRTVPYTGADTLVAVPMGAANFGVWNDKINPKLWTLPSDPSANPKYQFTYDYNKWNELKRGLGDYSVRAYDPKITLVPNAR